MLAGIILLLPFGDDLQEALVGGALDEVELDIGMI
jgi:hypothetical protein